MVGDDLKTLVDEVDFPCAHGIECRKKLLFPTWVFDPRRRQLPSTTRDNVHMLRVIRLIHAAANGIIEAFVFKQNVRLKCGQLSAVGSERGDA